MPKLSNNKVREQSIKEFLTDSSIKLETIDIHSSDNFYTFESPSFQSLKDFANEMSRLLDTPVHTCSILNFIESEISEATVVSETDRLSCKALIKITPMSYSYNKEEGTLEFTLPNPIYASMFNLLTYKTIKVDLGGKIVLNLDKYLNATKAGIVHFDGGNHSPFSLIVLNAEVLQTKTVVYTTKNLSEGRQEVTPYFLAPKSPVPPDFHFVLDVSASMEKDITKLKLSTLELVKQLFLVQPKATIKLITFSTKIKEIGSYQYSDAKRLEEDINKIQIDNSTCLHQVTLDIIQNIRCSSKHNNVLLFTDGVDTCSNSQSQENIRELCKQLNENQKANNKFYLFSYKVEQNNLMRDVSKIFMSPVINSEEIDFINEQNKSELMQSWAAARGLFTARMTIKSEQNSGTHIYSVPVDMSGQFVKLKSQILNPSEKLILSISEGIDSLVVESEFKNSRLLTSMLNSQSSIFNSSSTNQETSDLPNQCTM